MRFQYSYDNMRIQEVKALTIIVCVVQGCRSVFLDDVRPVVRGYIVLLLVIDMIERGMVALDFCQ